MQHPYSISRKQAEYQANATHRWNFKSGAVRSGKSYIDIYAVIPRRLYEVRGLPGIDVIFGVSRETIERNVLEPMREIYGPSAVGTINSRNQTTIFGENVYCLGAEKVSQAAKIQGATIKYAYGDEVAKWNKDVFRILQGRLDKTYSRFDGSCNPEHPTHWLKAFFESDADIYVQEYTIFDNPYISREFVENLCREYAGTVYYDRYILGVWKRAEGAIYRMFADNPAAFTVRIVDKNPQTGEIAREDITSIEVGIDFGGNRSGHAFVARGYTDDYRQVIILASQRVMAAETDAPIDANMLQRLFLGFLRDVGNKYGWNYEGAHNLEGVYWDSAETVLGETIRNAVERQFPWVRVRPALKTRINDRINTTLRLMGAGRFYVTEDAGTVTNALSEAVWDMSADKDVRLDDGSTDIDSLDAMEYTIERDIKYLIWE